MAQPSEAPRSEHEADADREINERYEQIVGGKAFGAYPPVDFTTFVLSLKTSCLISLGQADSASEIDLPMAHHEIELLSMLEEKTRGLLDGDEERLLLQVLRDLKVRFVKIASKN